MPRTSRGRARLCAQNGRIAARWPALRGKHANRRLFKTRRSQESEGARKVSRNASLAGGVLVCCLCLGLDGLIQNPVQALYEGGGVFQRHAFEQQGLVEGEPGDVFYLGVAGVGE